MTETTRIERTVNADKAFIALQEVFVSTELTTPDALCAVGDFLCWVLLIVANDAKEAITQLHVMVPGLEEAIRNNEAMIAERRKLAAMAERGGAKPN